MTRETEEPDASERTGPSAVPAPGPHEPFREVLSRFATGVTVVTTNVDGLDHAMTATAFTAVSLDPPLVLVCVEKIARFHDAVLASGSWAVSILDANAEEVSRWLATRGRPLHGQLAGIRYERGQTGAALLLDALAWLECRTWATYDGGDHAIVVGEVTAIDVAEEAGTAADHGGHATGAEQKLLPLLHYRRDYRRF